MFFGRIFVSGFEAKKKTNINRGSTCGNARLPFHGLPGLNLAAGETKTKAFGGQDVVTARFEVRI